MYWNRSAADIAAAWQTEIESKLETGAPAILLGGASSSMLNSATTLLALQNSTIWRNDIATPLLVAGGNSAHWLGLLLPPQPIGKGRSAPAPALIFGGADEATYWATVGLTVGLAAGLSTGLGPQSMDAAGAAKSGTSQEMGLFFAPRLQPGAATAWEMLPFVELGEQPVSAPVSLPALTAPKPDTTGDWLAWGTMLLALCLVLSALLI